MFKINKSDYEKMIAFFKKDKYRILAMKILYKVLPLIIFIAYPILIVYTFFYMKSELIKIVFVPFAVFVFVTVLRKILNKPRPYEVFNTPSLFDKDTKGQSMPSRHTASAFIIAMTFLYIDFYLGIIAFAIAFMIAMSRILSGVHYIRDILVGAGISVLTGIIFLFLI